jgi:hypothetical protein
MVGNRKDERVDVSAGVVAVWRERRSVREEGVLARNMKLVDWRALVIMQLTGVYTLVDFLSVCYDIGIDLRSQFRPLFHQIITHKDTCLLCKRPPLPPKLTVSVPQL